MFSSFSISFSVSLISRWVCFLFVLNEFRWCEPPIFSAYTKQLLITRSSVYEVKKGRAQSRIHARYQTKLNKYRSKQPMQSNHGKSCLSDENTHTYINAQIFVCIPVSMILNVYFRKKMMMTTTTTSDMAGIYIYIYIWKFSYKRYVIIPFGWWENCKRKPIFVYFSQCFW